MSGLLLIRDPCLLTAIHGADDGAIDDAHDATAFIGTVAAPSSRCRKQPSTRPSCRRTARQCCRAASAPRRYAPAVRVGLPPGYLGNAMRHTARNVVTVTAPIGKSAPGVIHSSSPWSVTRRLHGEWRSTPARRTPMPQRWSSVRAQNSGKSPWLLLSV